LIVPTPTIDTACGSRTPGMSEPFSTDWIWTAKFSSGSTAVSPITWIVIVPLVWPAGMVSVPFVTET
jgi:hypothetical protein